MNNHENLKYCESSHTQQTSQIEETISAQKALTSSEQSRREALRKIGIYSAYTAPAMMAIFSTQAHAS